MPPSPAGSSCGVRTRRPWSLSPAATASSRRRLRNTPPERTTVSVPYRDGRSHAGLDRAVGQRPVKASRDLCRRGSGANVGADLARSSLAGRSRSCRPVSPRASDTTLARRDRTRPPARSPPAPHRRSPGAGRRARRRRRRVVPRSWSAGRQSRCWRAASRGSSAPGPREPRSVSGRAGGSSESEDSCSHAQAIRHGCRIACAPPGSRTGMQRADPAAGADVAEEQLSAPQRTVGPVAGPVEDRPDRCPRLTVLGQAARPCARGGAGRRSARRRPAPGRTSWRGTPGAGHRPPARVQPRTDAGNARSLPRTTASVSRFSRSPM